jgi:diguanylate cyclase (GGDEF)-like protein
MPTQEGFLTIILAAIVFNLLLAIGLLVGPVIRRRLRKDDDLTDAEISRRVLLRAHLFGAGAEPEVPSADEASADEAEPSNAAAAFGRANPSIVDHRAPMADNGPLSLATVLADDSEVSSEGIDDDPGERDDRRLGNRPDIIGADTVTGFDGPATWAKRLTEENARVQRYGRAATVVLVELAGVDRLAERLGPDAAERLVPPIGTTMRRQARSADSLARLSATRFAVLLPDTDEVKAINYVERVRAACDVWLEAGAVSLRLSMGWAEINANQPVDPAVQTAEQRLNVERHRVRNRDVRDVDEHRDAAPTRMRPARAN